MGRDEAIQGLRELATFFEENSEAQMPSDQTFWLFVTTPEKLAAAAKTLGHATKSTDGNYYIVKRTFGFVTLEYLLNRGQVCKSEVIGKKKIKVKKVITPMIPAVTVEVEEEVDDVQWTCPESLLALTK